MGLCHNTISSPFPFCQKWTYPQICLAYVSEHFRKKNYTKNFASGLERFRTCRVVIILIFWIEILVPGTCERFPRRNAQRAASTDQEGLIRTRVSVRLYLLSKTNTLYTVKIKSMFNTIVPKLGYTVASYTFNTSSYAISLIKPHGV